jgi:hypothetical protein
MNRKAVIPAMVTLFALGAASAAAGPCTNEIDAVAKTLAAQDAGSGPTSGASGNAQSSQASRSEEHPPTATMKQQTEGKATSPEDVRRQNTGQPTAAQQGATATPSKKIEASNALDRARSLDQQGKEAECMNAVREAKQLAGAR